MAVHNIDAYSFLRQLFIRIIRIPLNNILWEPETSDGIHFPFVLWFFFLNSINHSGRFSLLMDVPRKYDSLVIEHFSALLAK